jgi:hypothetical protein
MTRMIDEDEAEKEIVYDSQEEEDAWPDSQSATQSREVEVLSRSAKTNRVSVYGKRWTVNDLLPR